MTRYREFRASVRGSLRRLLLAATLLLTSPYPAAATDMLYSDEALAVDQPRYAERFDFLLERGLRDFMTSDERRALADVVVDQPLRGRDLLTSEAQILGGFPVVTVPVSTLKLIEDISIVYAWRYRNGFTLEPIDEYLALLKLRHDAFASGRAEPLVALGVPPRILETDPNVDDLSLRFRNSAWAFMLAHELGHLRFGDLDAPATASEVQRQEEAADAFAADLLARSNTIPMGMILWFQATAGYFPNRADFASDAAYSGWLATRANHPVNGRRMRNLAAALERQAGQARDRNSRDVLRFIATRLRAIGEIVEDPDMQRHLRRCAQTRDTADLTRREDRPCS